MWNEILYAGEKKLKLYQMKIGMAQAAVLDVDVNVKVAGSNPANLKLFELGLFGLLANGGDFVGRHFLCRAKNIDWVVLTSKKE